MQRPRSAEPDENGIWSCEVPPTEHLAYVATEERASMVLVAYSVIGAVGFVMGVFVGWLVWG